jgi:hypothetical protein
VFQIHPFVKSEKLIVSDNPGNTSIAQSRYWILFEVKKGERMGDLLKGLSVFVLLGFLAYWSNEYQWGTIMQWIAVIGFFGYIALLIKT